MPPQSWMPPFHDATAYISKSFRQRPDAALLLEYFTAIS
jgi:hypothetical protein